MRAVTFDVSVPRYLLAKSIGRISDWAVYGAPSSVKLHDVPRPSLPGPSWARLKVLSCGICGSDIGNISYSSSPAMEPFGSFPAVLGHEILARVEEVGSAVRGVEVGQRVAVDPMISCTARGYPGDDLCGSCRAGLHSTCQRAGDDGLQQVGEKPMGPGLTMGYHRDLPGGWGEEMIAHESQLFPVSDVVPDRRAVLTEPVSIGVHAALQSTAHRDEPVFVIGSGPIAFGTIWALRALGFDGTLIGQTKRKHEADLARQLGASEVVSPGPAARQALVETGAMAYQPIVGPEVFEGGGFPLIFDCVGRASSLGQALRFAAPRGRIVVLGCAGQIPKLDLTFLWARELNVKGYVGYGAESWKGSSTHTFRVTHELMEESGSALDNMVTHVFPLEEYRTALAAASSHRTSGAIKVLMEP